MNKFLLMALIVLVGSTALRDQIGDNGLTVGVGLGVVLTIIGLSQVGAQRR